MSNLNFNAQDVAPQQAFENLAPGWYTAMITESEMKPTQAGTGSYLEITLEVVAPAQFAGRKLWDRLNLNNPNEKAVEIAYQTLSAICHATGVIQVQDSQQLHQIPMDVKVGMSKVTEQYPEPRNEVKGYRASQGGSTMQQPMQQTQQPVQQQQQQPVQQQQQPANNAWQQPAQQQPVQQQQTQQPVQQQQQANSWQNANAQQPVQQQAEAQQQQTQQPVQELKIQQQATDPNAQAAAQGNKAPWQN